MPGRHCAVRVGKLLPPDVRAREHDSTSAPLQRSSIEQKATGCVDRQMVAPPGLTTQPQSVVLCRFPELARAGRRQLIGFFNQEYDPLLGALGDLDLVAGFPD